MIKHSFWLTFRIVAFIIGYYVLSMYIDDIYIIIGVVVISIPMIIYNYINKGKYEYLLEILCDPSKYTEIIKTKYIKKDESIYQLCLAYGYVYSGDYDNALLAINKVDHLVVEKSLKHNLMYYIVMLKLAYNNQDLDEYNILLLKLQKIELDKNNKIDIKIFDIPVYMLEKKYTEVIELLHELIPLQRKRFILMELEYYLALAYLEVGNKIDAIAVLEFVSKEKYHLIYNKLASELLETVRNPV